MKRIANLENNTRKDVFFYFTYNLYASSSIYDFCE